MTDVPRLEAYHFFEEDWEGFEQVRSEFEWEIPDRFNIAEYVCDRWADDRSRVALFSEDGDGERETYTYWRVRNLTDRLASALADRGIGRGDRIGVNTGQRPATLLAHVAAWKLGAVSIPLSTLFGTDGLGYRLSDCEASVVVVDEANVDTIREVRDGDEHDLDLEVVLTAGDATPREDERGFDDVVAEGRRGFENATTSPDDTACIFYTSGTTGPPKGVVHGHRLVLGNAPLFVVSIINMSLEEDDLMWTPSEWAWIGTLPSYVLPMLFYGKPVLAYAGGSFDPEEAFRLVEDYGVTVSLFPPTSLRMMRTSDAASEYDLGSMRVVSSGGESLGENLRGWITDAFDGAAVNEVYGQTEADGIVGECEALFDPREGSMGKPLPGHDVRIVDPETVEEVSRNETGEIAVRYEGNPVCFTEYWNLPEATAEKVREGWLLTEDLGEMDADGYVTFVGRTDDVIISAGYRIGPEEIEDVLAAHEAVAAAGVIGIPDEERGEVPKAFVQLADGYEASEDMKEDLRESCKERLALYEYPREIEFIAELPTTSTGKIRRMDLRRREGIEGD